MNCNLCPRKCGADRSAKAGFCGARDHITVAKIMLHAWEEPCICNQHGCGAIFFSGCQLRCIFCQNHEISTTLKGESFSPEELCDVFFKLQDAGACNINLVSPTPYLPDVAKSLELAKICGLSLPIVFNSGGFESKEALKMMDGLVDVYLPDFKFFSADLANTAAKAPNYPEIVKEALEEMVRQVGKPTWKNGRLLRGVMVRHLVLPSFSSDSIRILEYLSEKYGKDGIVLSLMRQYTPMYKAKNLPPFHRKVTSLEYDRVTKIAEKIGFQWIYTQEKESATEQFVPDFSENALLFLDK